MELPTSRPHFSLDALIAEAKRRARQRRLLVSVLILAAAAAAAGLVLGFSGGGGSQSSGLPGRLGDQSAPSRGTSPAGRYVIPHFSRVGARFKVGDASCELSWNRWQSQASCVTAASNSLPASVAAVARQRLLALRRARPIGLCGTETFPFEDENVTSVSCTYSAPPPSPTH
jgi:hypothetical protein